MRDLGLGFSAYFRSFGFIFSKGLASYFLYPIAIVLILTLLFANMIDYAVDGISGIVYGLFDIGHVDPEVEGWWEKMRWWLGNITKVTTSVVLYIVFYYVYLKLNKYIVLILMSPVMALLSEKTEEVLTGNVYPFEWNQFMKDIWRGILMALRNMLIEFGWILAVWMLGLLLGMIFPPIMLIYTPASVIFLFVVGAYFYGFSTMDYTNERQRLGVAESVDFIRKHKGIAIANGAIFNLWLFIPIIGPIIAPITCTVGATLAIAERKDLSASGFALKKTSRITE